MNKKQHRIFPLLFCVVLICVIGFYVHSKISSSASTDHFSVTAFPAEIIADGNINRLEYSFLVDNTSQQQIENLKVTLVLNSALEDYFASGQTTAFLGKYDLVSKTDAETGKNLAFGIECHHSPALVDKDDYSDCYTLGRTIKIVLEWGSKTETHTVDVDVIDCR